MIEDFTPWHVGVSAEAVTAALFARIGLDVSVQYGANQPEYDLMVASGNRILKVSVKGSKDGAWGLTQLHLKHANYHEAIDRWLDRHRPGTVMCFVQFCGTTDTEMPRVYLASPSEVARHLKYTRKGHGDTILYECHKWIRGCGAGTIDKVPDTWRFSVGRVETLLTNIGKTTS